MATDASEWGLETLVVRAMTGDWTGAPLPGSATREAPEPFGDTGWIPGDPHSYDREHAVDFVQLAAFLRATQPEVAGASTWIRTARQRQGRRALCRQPFQRHPPTVLQPRPDPPCPGR